MNKRVPGKHSADNWCKVTELNAYEQVNNPKSSAPKSALYSLLCTILYQKRYPFKILSIEKGTPFYVATEGKLYPFSDLFYTLELTKIQLLGVLGVSQCSKYLNI